MSRLTGIEDQFPEDTRDVPLASMSENDCITAIKQAASSLEERAAEAACFFRFMRADGAVLYEDEFYEHVRTCPGAAPALVKLIEAATRNVEFESPNAMIFAAQSLAWIDQTSLLVVARMEHGEGPDFDEEDLEALVTRHDWTPAMLDFIFAKVETNWTFQFNHDRWLDRLFEAAKASHSPEALAAHHHDLLAHELGFSAGSRSTSFDDSSFGSRSVNAYSALALKRGLSQWDAAYFAEFRRLAKLRGWGGI